jgi:hypothetical protein
MDVPASETKLTRTTQNLNDKTIAPDVRALREAVF